VTSREGVQVHRSRGFTYLGLGICQYHHRYGTGFRHYKQFSGDDGSFEFAFPFECEAYCLKEEDCEYMVVSDEWCFFFDSKCQEDEDGEIIPLTWQTKVDHSASHIWKRNSVQNTFCQVVSDQSYHDHGVFGGYQRCMAATAGFIGADGPSFTEQMSERALMYMGERCQEVFEVHDGGASIDGGTSRCCWSDQYDISVANKGQPQCKGSNVHICGARLNNAPLRASYLHVKDECMFPPDERVDGGELIASEEPSDTSADSNIAVALPGDTACQAFVEVYDGWHADHNYDDAYSLKEIEVKPIARSHVTFFRGRDRESGQRFFYTPSGFLRVPFMRDDGWDDSHSEDLLRDHYSEWSRHLYVKVLGRPICETAIVLRLAVPGETGCSGRMEARCTNSLCEGGEEVRQYNTNNDDMYTLKHEWLRRYNYEWVLTKEGLLKLLGRNYCLMLKEDKYPIVTTCDPGNEKMRFYLGTKCEAKQGYTIKRVSDGKLLGSDQSCSSMTLVHDSGTSVCDQWNAVWRMEDSTTSSIPYMDDVNLDMMNLDGLNMWMGMSNAFAFHPFPPPNPSPPPPDHRHTPHSHTPHSHHPHTPHSHTPGPSSSPSTTNEIRLPPLPPVSLVCTRLCHPQWYALAANFGCECPATNTYTPGVGVNSPLFFG